MPPLMGWAAATGRVEAPALALFALMFVWQIPHFVAISIFRAEDYQAAGFRVLSFARQPRLTRTTVLLSSAALLPVSLLLAVLGVAGPVYTVVAGACGVMFVVRAAGGLRLDPADPRARRWAKGLFLYSLLYLVALFGALAVDRAL
jgi:protoheme IX farnesyltransferase